MTELQNLSLPLEAPPYYQTVGEPTPTESESHEPASSEPPLDESPTYETPPNEPLPNEPPPGYGLECSVPGAPNINTVPGPPSPRFSNNSASCQFSISYFDREIQGLVYDMNGRVPGYAPEDQHRWTVKAPPLFDAMAESGMTEKWWRVAELYDQCELDIWHSWHLCCLNIMGGCCLLPLCYTQAFCGRQHSLFRSSPSNHKEKTFGFQKRGWKYHAAPEVAIDWVLVRDEFRSIQKMRDIAKLAYKQQRVPIDVIDRFHPTVPTVAPGGQWARALSDPEAKRRIVRILDDHLLVFTFEFLAHPEQTPAHCPHGVKTPVTLEQAVEALFAAEREFMSKLTESRYVGYAVPVWPSIVYLT